MGSYISSLGRDNFWEPHSRRHSRRRHSVPRHSVPRHSVPRHRKCPTCLCIPRRSSNPKKGGHFGSQCLGYGEGLGRVPPPFGFGRRRKSNKMAAKVMRYYQAHRDQGVTLRDAWKKFNNRKMKMARSHKRRKHFAFDFGNSSGNLSGDLDYGTEPKDYSEGTEGTEGTNYGGRPNLTSYGNDCKGRGGVVSYGSNFVGSPQNEAYEEWI